jgi:hypothetical protein
LTDLAALLYGDPMHLDRWAVDYRNLNLSGPWAGKFQDSPMLAELRPVLMRFHPDDAEKVHSYLSLFSGNTEHFFTRNFRPLTLSLSLLRRIAGPRWKKPGDFARAADAVGNGWIREFGGRHPKLRDVSVLPVAEGEDSYKWGV